MRIFLSLVCMSILSVSSIQAQQHYCGADYPQEMHNWMYDLQNNQDHSRLSAPNDIEYLPILLHNLGTDDGVGYFSLEYITAMMCRMNNQFIPTGFYFYLTEVNYINNTEWYAYTDFNIGDDMMYGSNEPDVINFYINADPAGNCGYYTYGADAIAVRKSCAGASDDTPAHEVGHYMSLPHPFYGWEGSDYYNDPIPNFQRERVDGSNCTTTGDLLCDTEPDYISNLWGCIPPTDMYDPNGDQVTPDTSLYMSYSNDACNSRFTEDQQFAMQQFLVQQRQDLIQSTPPNIKVTVGQPEAAFPIGGITMPYNNVTLAWTGAEGLDYYRVELVSPTIGVTAPPAIQVTDTFVVMNLEPDATYYWKVMAFSLTSFCNNDFSTSKVFNTSSESTSLSVENVDISISICPGDNVSTASITASGGQPPYNYDWNGADPANLSDGVYQVTITDASGDMLIYPVVVDEPDALNVNMEIIDASTNTIEIDAFGGTGPYTYLWPNGSTDTTFPWLPTGTYAVEIIDANGCTQIVNIEYEAALTIDDQNVVHQQCLGTLSGSADIEVFGGVEPYDIEWGQGVNPSALYPGDYDVLITDAAGTELMITVTINEVTQLIADYTIIDPALNIVEVDIMGGTSPYTIAWPDGYTLATYVGLETGTYTVNITDANGCETMTTFYYEATSTSIAEFIVDNIEISPNPAASSISIRTESEILYSAIIDMNGKVVHQQASDSTIDISGLSESIYILRVQSSEGISYTKLVIAR